MFNFKKHIGDQIKDLMVLDVLLNEHQNKLKELFKLLECDSLQKCIEIVVGLLKKIKEKEEENVKLLKEIENCKLLKKREHCEEEEEEKTVKFSSKRDVQLYYSKLLNGDLEVNCGLWGDADIVTKDHVFIVKYGVVNILKVSRQAVGCSNQLGGVKPGLILPEFYMYHDFPEEIDRILFY